MTRQAELYPALVVGGGMITREVILPTLFQLQRRGELGEISVCSRRGRTLRRLREMFPGNPFRAYPGRGRETPKRRTPNSTRKPSMNCPRAASCSSPRRTISTRR